MLLNRLKRQTKEKPSNSRSTALATGDQVPGSVDVSMKPDDIQQKEQLKQITEKNDPARESGKTKTGRHCGFATGN